MKSIILILFITGIVLISVGYTKNQYHCPAPKIEYRYVPRSFYEEQNTSTNLKNLYSDMFDKQSTWSSYPFNQQQNNYDSKNYSNFVEEDDS